MLSGGFHFTDQELLAAADGELSTRRAAQVRAHLVSCWDCRARMAEVEATIADFVRAHRQAVDPQVPPIAGPRALLRAQLAELAAKPKPGPRRQFFHLPSVARAAAYICVIFLVAAACGKLLLQHSAPRGANSQAVLFEHEAIPDRRLTPGAARAVTIRDVCSMAHEDVVREVPASMRREIFREYEIVNAHAEDYEIDYLIAPGLGGTEDIHNLWPEPYTSTTWNAHVKDALEEQLHQMVCAGKVDLSTAQNDIATDWIAAYKKYFHTDAPLGERSNLIRPLKRHLSS
jgi:Putative zinc-finger